MTKPIAEQVAEVKVGDWVIAEFYDVENGNKWGVKGNLYSGAGDSLIIGNYVIRFNTGDIDSNLTSITRAPRPIPSEPGVGSFALVDEGELFQRIDTDATGWKKVTSSSFYDWKFIFPHITRLYTPSGDLVTGFEYATSKAGDA